MAYDEFFTDQDKPYAENLNDSLMLCDAFDVTVPAEMPTMFSNGEFNSTVNVTRKCGVALVTLKSVGSGVTVGTSSISGTGDVVFRVYPNFNSFYKWSKILLEKSGTVSIAFYKTDGTEISATVGSDGTISENSALKQLQEIDVVLTLSNASISNVLIEFINNQTSRTRTGALLEASQLVNVNGAVSSGEAKAVNGGTVKTALDNLQSSINEDIEDLSDVVDTKEDSANKVTSLDSNSAHYPSCTAVNDGLNAKENVSNKVTSLDNSDTHYPSSKAVKTITDAKENKVYTQDLSGSDASHGYSWVGYNNGSRRYIVVFLSNFSISSNQEGLFLDDVTYDPTWAPRTDDRKLLPEGLYAELDAEGGITIRNPLRKNVSNLSCSFKFQYVLKSNLRSS